MARFVDISASYNQVADMLTPAEWLELLRAELRAERMSYGELALLQSLAEHIEDGDVELLQAAGVPEFEEVWA